MSDLYRGVQGWSGVRGFAEIGGGDLLGEGAFCDECQEKYRGWGGVREDLERFGEEEQTAVEYYAAAGKVFGGKCAGEGKKQEKVENLLLSGKWEDFKWYLMGFVC